MTECRESRASKLQIRLDRSCPESGAARFGAVAAAFAKAARLDDMLVLVGLPPCGGLQRRRSDLRATLRLYISRRSAALKMVEAPPAAANPTRVSRWLETSFPHISLVFSPLKERGPPRI
jgi:hypothetical protein